MLPSQIALYCELFWQSSSKKIYRKRNGILNLPESEFEKILNFEFFLELFMSKERAFLRFSYFLEFLAAGVEKKPDVSCTPMRLG